MKSSIEKINKKLKSVNKKLKRLFVEDKDSLVALKNGNYGAYEPLDSTSKNVLKRFLLERSLAKHTVLNLLQGYYVENLWHRPLYVCNSHEVITQAAKVTYSLGNIRDEEVTLELVFPLAGKGNSSFEWSSTILIARMVSGEELVEEVALRLNDTHRSLSAMFGQLVSENTKLRLILFNARKTVLYPEEAVQLLDDYVNCFSRVEHINVEEHEVKAAFPSKEPPSKELLKDYMDTCKDEFWDDIDTRRRAEVASKKKKEAEESNGKRYRSGVDINRLINRKRRVL